MKLERLLGLAALVCACAATPKTPIAPLPDPGADEPVPVEAADFAFPEIPSQPAPVPESVVATISIGEPMGQLDRLGAFSDAVKFGSGALVVSEELVAAFSALVGLGELEGIDARKPFFALNFDDAAVPQGWLIAVAVADETALRNSVQPPGGARVQVHAGYAAIGSEQALTEGAAYALSSLVTSEPPAPFQIQLRMPQLLRAHGPALQQRTAEIVGDGLASQGLMAALSALEDLTIQIEFSHEGTSVTARARPMQGPLAALVAAQAPSTFARVADLGNTSYSTVAAGRLNLEPLTPVLEELSRGALAGAAGKVALLLTWASQEMVLATNAPLDDALSMTVTAVDADAEAKSIEQLLAALVGEGLTYGDALVRSKPRALAVGGGRLHELTFAPSPLLSPEESEALAAKFGPRGIKAYLGIARDRFVATYGFKADARARAMSRVKTGARITNAQLAAAVEQARAHGASLLVTLDVAAILSGRKREPIPPATLDVSFSAGAAELRAFLPAVQAQRVRNMFGD